MQFKGMDEMDQRIVNLLLKDGRMSYSALSECVGLSRTAVKTRVERLEREGLIKGYRAVIDPQAVPEMTTFIVNIETTAESFEECKDMLCAIQEVVTLVQTTGNCRFVAICLSKDMKTMRDFLQTFYQRAPGVLSIHAQAVIDVMKGCILPET